MGGDIVVSPFIMKFVYKTQPAMNKMPVGTAHRINPILLFDEICVQSLYLILPNNKVTLTVKIKLYVPFQFVFILSSFFSLSSSNWDGPKIFQNFSISTKFLFLLEIFP